MQVLYHVSHSAGPKGKDSEIQVFQVRVTLVTSFCVPGKVPGIFLHSFFLSRAAVLCVRVQERGQKKVSDQLRRTSWRT
jgi:hypothetical protein